MRRIKLTIEYNGQPYWGWQKLTEPDAGPTVQGCIESAWYKLTEEQVNLSVAGRTDRGVHASAQVAHFDTASTLPLTKIMGGLNHHIHPNIIISRVAVVDNTFHARHSAGARSYTFHVYNRRVVPPWWHGRASVWRTGLNVELMNTAAQQLVGEHDFSAFRSADCQSKVTMVDMQHIEISYNDELITMHIRANHFLHNMVRIIMGTLCEIGAGQRPVESLTELLQNGNRTQAGPTLPPDGLSLTNVSYPPHAEHEVLELGTTKS